jgi:hypothetical protein
MENVYIHGNETKKRTKRDRIRTCDSSLVKPNLNRYTTVLNLALIPRKKPITISGCCVLYPLKKRKRKGKGAGVEPATSPFHATSPTTTPKPVVG